MFNYLQRFIEELLYFVLDLIGYDPIVKINKIIKDNNIDIQLNGTRKHDIKINNPRCLYKIAFGDPELTFGETYMKNDWECEDLEGMLTAIFKSNLFNTLDKQTNSYKLLTRFVNMQNIIRSKQVGTQHYDIGNDLYEAILDPNMQYSCGYWNNAHSLDDAQNNKLDLLCRKLGLFAYNTQVTSDKIKILDVGCGFGGLAKYIVDRYPNVEITGLSISKEQIRYAEEHFNANKLNSRIMIYFQDYRTFCNDRENFKRFDRVISVGMFEHVGYKNYETYFDSVHKVLKDGPENVFVLHTIGNNKSVTCGNRWIDRYIFPNGMLPSIAQIGTSIENKFVMEDWSNFGDYYADTLQAWLENSETFFKQTTNPIYTEEFKRMWRLYLISSKVNFRLRQIQLWQLVLSPKGVKGIVLRQS